MTPEEIKPNEYQCCKCGGVFEKGWTDEEAKAEMVKNFGTAMEDVDVLCDDCYNEFITRTFN